MNRYWIIIASKNHVLQGVSEGFAQANHGKSWPLKRMKTGDGVIYYSPKLEPGGKVPCKCFTAIGQVIGDEVYEQDMGNNFTPSRRKMQYLRAKDVSVVPLINSLSFIKDKKHWGAIFRFGIISIPKEDFALIATAMAK